MTDGADWLLAALAAEGFNADESCPAKSSLDEVAEVAGCSGAVISRTRATACA